MNPAVKFEQPSREQKLARIAELQDEHQLTGLSIQRRNDHTGIEPLDVDAAIDYVLATTEKTVQLIADAKAGKIRCPNLDTLE